MSNTIANLISNQINNISTLLVEDDIIIDLKQLIDDFSSDFLLGYYFTDEQEKIIAGNVIYKEKTEKKTHKTWITIPVKEIPTNAVSLSFFMD